MVIIEMIIKMFLLPFNNSSTFQQCGDEMKNITRVFLLQIEFIPHVNSLMQFRLSMSRPILKIEPLNLLGGKKDTGICIKFDLLIL